VYLNPYSKAGQQEEQEKGKTLERKKEDPEKWGEPLTLLISSWVCPGAEAGTPEAGGRKKTWGSEKGI